MSVLGRARLILLGETHDNAEHHRLQAAIYRDLAAANLKPPSAVFEMLDADDHATLNAALAAGPAEPQTIATAVQWDQSGWPAFPLYEPIFAEVLAAEGKILPAGLPRQQAMTLADGRAFEPLGPYTAKVNRRYNLRQALPEALQASQRDLMQQSHCGMLPEEMLDGMVHIQRVRDALMAEGLRLGLGKAQEHQAILIAGKGHVRRDVGVPQLLTQIGLGPVVTVGLVEQPTHHNAPQPTLTAEMADHFDYIIWTQPGPEKDHCAELKQRFGQHGKHGKHGQAVGDLQDAGAERSPNGAP